MWIKRLFLIITDLKTWQKLQQQFNNTAANLMQRFCTASLSLFADFVFSLSSLWFSPSGVCTCTTETWCIPDYWTTSSRSGSTTAWWVHDGETPDGFNRDVVSTSLAHHDHTVFLLNCLQQSGAVAASSCNKNILTDQTSWFTGRSLLQLTRQNKTDWKHHIN